MPGMPLLPWGLARFYPLEGGEGYHDGADIRVGGQPKSLRSDLRFVRKVIPTSPTCRKAQHVRFHLRAATRACSRPPGQLRIPEPAQENQTKGNSQNSLVLGSWHKVLS